MKLMHTFHCPMYIFIVQLSAKQTVAELPTFLSKTSLILFSFTKLDATMGAALKEQFPFIRTFLKRHMKDD